MKTIADGKKDMKARKKIVFGTEVIYARAFALQHVNPDLDFEKLLVFEVGLCPTSVFNKKEQCIFATRNRN